MDFYFVGLIATSVFFSFQSINAVSLTLVGPVYRHYIDGFWTKEPKKIDEWIFNGVYIITMSLAYPPYMFLFRRFSNLNTSLIYGACFLFLGLLLFGVVFPYLETTGKFD